MRAVWEFSVQAWEDASRAPNERLRILGVVGPAVIRWTVGTRSSIVNAASASAVTVA